jgi:DNA-binding response OmpR family regulator
VPPDTGGFRVLVVDDDPAYARLVAKVVEAAGFSCLAVAASGAEALRLADEADLVLLDQQLPDADGLSLLPALRSMSRRPAVILVTAHGDEALAAGALRAGADDYLIKEPALPRLLPEVVERARRNRALQEALAAAERDLVHAERLAAIGQLNVTLSHNLNNPLMAAIAETGLLLADRSLAPEQRASVDAIRQALQRISDILHQVSTLRHDQTTAYPGGLEMIDLSLRNRRTPVNTGDALLWLPDDTLARVVGSLLKHAGFSIERVADAATLAERAAQAGVTAAVLQASNVPGTDPLGGFRPVPGHSYLLVALVAGDAAAARAAGADHVVSLPFDPGTFASELFAATRGM